MSSKLRKIRSKIFISFYGFVSISVLYFAAFLFIENGKSLVRIQNNSSNEALSEFTTRFYNSLKYSDNNKGLFNLNKEHISSAWHNIDKSTISLKNYLYHYSKDKDYSELPGGYIDIINDEIIIGSNGKGEMFLFNVKKKSAHKLNSNLSEIFASQNYKRKVIKNLRGRFGVRDIYLDRKYDRVLASMVVDVNGQGCYGMAIYESKIILNPSFDKSKRLNFTELFKTNSCNSDFGGHALGGRINRLNNKILFTVGDLDHNLDGDIRIAQSKKNAIGKVISIDNDGSFKVISMGHRNQQGMVIFNGKVIITEHGPRGGDEINLISDGKHYGWPYYSYGIGYDFHAKHRVKHTNKYKKPIFYFTPSIAISEIIHYKGNEFPYWKDKLIVSSLKAKSLFLLDIDPLTMNILSVERIYVGHRIRDIKEMPSGSIVFITDDQNIVFLNKSLKSLILDESKIPFIK
ncbi:MULTISPECIES: PQQ-dependent sugar dehydrogenase [unclassified Prochlorococcus]|uniref:PQQ-dependent sugar dehydrogenase n=1 Tax=unclassified Prochlorococcus TaxID=2627481 RepID=UPI00053377B2|nr:MULTISPECIES: PQQ-dependent sugar dehydrogenase [unclassified Prochlorococcus]KGG16343.1 glucose sorbosone dehydrogenase [Prochlorococcus sp. MIT 0603]KGG17923.1 glucose sorbosone dehydrogenase [Prochlorococcus sp. MIT 0602]